MKQESLVMTTLMGLTLESVLLVQTNSCLMDRYDFKYEQNPFFSNILSDRSISTTG